MNSLKPTKRESIRTHDHEKELQLLQTLILSISQAGDVQTAIAMVLCNVCKATGWTYGQAWQVREGEKVLECCPAWYAVTPGLKSFRKTVETLTLAPGQSLAGKAWVFKEPVWTADIRAEGEATSLAQAWIAGFRAGLGIPVIAGDDVVLVLEFFLHAPTQEDKSHIQLVTAIAAQLGWLIQKKIAEEAFRESVERFELAVRGSRDGLWDAKIPQDRDWHSPDMPIYYSRRFKQLLGYTETEIGNVLGEWESRLHPDDRTRVLAALNDHLEKRLPYDVEYRLRVKGGEFRWFSARGAAVWNAAGRPVRSAGAIRDITDRKRMEQSLYQSEKIAAVGQLAAGIAHELNNPLHTVLGYAQALIQQIQGPETATRALRFIEKEARRCQTLVQNLLTFARHHNRGFSVESPYETVEEVLSLIEAQAKVKRIILAREFTPNLPSLQLDRDRIRQMLLNLCTNAMDAMPQGGTLTVRMALGRHAADSDNSVLRIEVEDTGEGIPEDLRHRIFEPFFTTKDVGRGTGLGLSLAYEIVKFHRGDISVSSEVGKGSLFQILLPLTPHD